MIRAASLCILVCATLAAPPLYADGFRVRAEFGLDGAWADSTSLENSLGFRNMANISGGLRLMWDETAGPFHFEVHSNLTFLRGDGVGYATAVAPFTPPAPPLTLFDLTSTWHNGTDTLVTNTIDRASVSFTSESLVLKIGRQAITWGAGMVFHPSDIIAPFPPNALDTSYKPGVDMIYAQYLFTGGADIQAIAVPRAKTTGGPVDFDASTVALRASASVGSLDGSLILARDRGDTVASLDLSGPLGGATWNAEYVHWVLSTGETHPSWLLNISNFGKLGDWNTFYYAEYFHNGFGVDASVPMDALPVGLTKRMSTGQVFFAGRDFIALGAKIEMTPVLSVTPSAILSLNDDSALASVAVNYSLAENTDLIFDYSHPIGQVGTEFGGREISAGSGIYFKPSRTASLRLVHYF